MKKTIVWVIVATAVVLGGWWAYNTFFAEAPVEAGEAPKMSTGDTRDSVQMAKDAAGMDLSGLSAVGDDEQ